MAGANCKCSCEEFESLCKCYYEEFEPLCKWHRQKGLDILEVHLKDFKKEQVCVKINNCGILKIKGECLLDGTRRSHFYKEIKISKDCNTNKIRAKLSNGILSIMMPKKICNVTKEDFNIREWCAEKKLKTIENDRLCRCKEPTYLECGFESTTYPLAVKVTVAVAVVVAALATYYGTYMCR